MCTYVCVHMCMYVHIHAIMCREDLFHWNWSLFVHAEYQEHPSSHVPPTGEWVLTDIAERSQLGSELRVKEKEEILIAAGIDLVHVVFFLYPEVCVYVLMVTPYSRTIVIMMTPYLTTLAMWSCWLLCLAMYTWSSVSTCSVKSCSSIYTHCLIQSCWGGVGSEFGVWLS